MKLTATEEDAIAALTELRQPNGRYRLDPVDSQGRTCGAVHTVLDYQRPTDAGTEDAADDDYARCNTPAGNDTDKVVIDSLLGTIKELAAANASTSARIGEALATNAQHGGDKLGSVVEVFARLFSLASESAPPRDVLVQQPNDAARSGGAEMGGALGAVIPHLAPVVATKAGAFVDALIARLRQPASPAPPAWPRNGYGYPPALPHMPVPIWPPPPDLPQPDFRFAGWSSSAPAAATEGASGAGESPQGNDTPIPTPNGDAS
jgi:hypothetical protein